MALIGTGDVRAWLNIPDEDKKPNTKIATLIDAIQGFVENYCDRPLEAKLYKTDANYCYFDGTGFGFMFLPVWPVWYVNEVAIDANREWGSATLVGTDDIIVYEKEGKIVSEASYFSHGKRNVRVEYFAGYGSITGTHWGHDGQGPVSFAVPYDLKQVLTEMVVAAFNEGITGIHTVVQPAQAEALSAKMINMLTLNGFWKQTLDRYKKWDSAAAAGYYV